MPLYRNSYTGGERISVTPLGYPYIEIDEVTGELTGEHEELAVMTADAIMAEVGEDADLAQAALDDEQARDKPRTSLVAKLERVIANAGS